MMYNWGGLTFQQFCDFRDRFRNQSGVQDRGTKVFLSVTRLNENRYRSFQKGYIESVDLCSPAGSRH